jgi:hypothetical protein
VNKLDYVSIEIEIIEKIADVITESKPDVNLPVMPF